MKKRACLAAVAFNLCFVAYEARWATAGAPATTTYLVVYKPGPSWLQGKPIVEQPLKEHGRYILSLYVKGSLKSGGPFSTTPVGPRSSRRRTMKKRRLWWLPIRLLAQASLLPSYIHGAWLIGPGMSRSEVPGGRRAAQQGVEADEARQTSQLRSLIQCRPTNTVRVRAWHPIDSAASPSRTLGAAIHRTF